MDIAAETTARVVVSRRLQVLTRLGVALGEVDDLEDLRRTALKVLAEDHADLPEVELVLGGGSDATADDLAVEGDGWLRFGLPVADRSVRGSVLPVRRNDRLPLDEGFLDFLRVWPRPSAGPWTGRSPARRSARCRRSSRSAS